MDQIFEFIQKNNIPNFRPNSSPISDTQNSKSEPSIAESKKDKTTKDEDEMTPQDLAPVILVLEFRLTGRTGYYFVSHPDQSLFWLDPFDFSFMLDDVHMEQTDWLVGLQMKSHYWYHNELFPHLYELTDEDIEEVDDIFGYAIGGKSLSDFLFSSMC